MPLEYVLDTIEHGVRLVCTGELEEGSVRRLEAAVDAARDGAQLFELDLSGVTAIDSHALRGLIEIVGRLEVKGVVASLVPSAAIVAAAAREGIGEILGI